MRKFAGKVAEVWQPTFENVTREFINDTLYKILFSDDIPNFKFDFREPEAIKFIEESLLKNMEQYYPGKVQKIMESLTAKTLDNETMPVMVVNDYKKFFEYLRIIYEKHIELFFKRTDMSAFTRWEKDNLFELIWLRATPEDFNNPETFLRKQAEMMLDTTFDVFDEEICIGPVELFNNNILCAQNGIARTWDESFREMKFTVYDKEHFENIMLFNRPCYELPVIRYGIYEKDGKKVCRIGSIQEKGNDYRKTSLQKEIDRRKYKANEGVDKEDTEQVEPKKLIALTLFINLLHKEGITDIEVPGLYVLDYEFHEKRSMKILKEFQEKWTEDKKEKHPDRYEEELYYLKKSCGKEDVISEIKSESLIAIVKRLILHYPNADIKAYPGDVDSFMHLVVPVVRNKNQINGSMFRGLYSVLDVEGIDR